jgi:hypothetical protein
MKPNTSSLATPSRVLASRPPCAMSYFQRGVFGKIASALAVMLLLSDVTAVKAANILWVSDASPASATGGVFSPPGSGYTDSGFVTLLQNAGHNVMRFNNADAQAVLLTPAEIAAINTNDLVIIGRASGSGAFRVGAGTGGGPGQGSNWNAAVTAPLICMSPFLVRTLADNRMGWFVGDGINDDTPCVLGAVDQTSAATDFLFGGVPMIGTNTAQFFDEIIDRNTSHIPGLPVPGGVILARATYLRDDTAVAASASVIVGFPVGTVVAGGSNILAGYRMYFAGGSRESATAPNAIPLYTGRENLTATGEGIFLRAVQLALNSGVPPATDPSWPVGVTQQPVATSVVQGGSVTFSITVTGAAPRTVQWQRDIGDGMTFTNIPDASTTFQVSSYTLTNVSLADNDAVFRVEVSNPNNAVTSDLAKLTVTKDTTPPVLLSAGSLDGNTITLCFSEKLDNSSGVVTDNFSYQINGGVVGYNIGTLHPDGQTVTLPLLSTISGSFTVSVDLTTSIPDLFGNVLDASTSLVKSRVLNLTSAAVGTVNPAGTVVSCAPKALTLTAGGLDLATTIDSFYFVNQTMTGDFDARVRVASLVANNRKESVGKAILTVRESTATNSAAVNIFVTPLTPGDNSVSSSVRTGTGAVTNTLGVSIVGGSVPRWMRVVRVGNLFTTSTSTDGTTWVTLGSTNAALSASLLVGVGAASHRNGTAAVPNPTVTASFTDLQISSLPTIFDSVYTGGSFSARLATAIGFEYPIEYKNSLAPGPWTLLTTLSGDGSVQNFTDPGPVSPTDTRFYRARVVCQ